MYKLGDVCDTHITYTHVPLACMHSYTHTYTYMYVYHRYGWVHPTETTTTPSKTPLYPWPYSIHIGMYNGMQVS